MRRLLLAVVVAPASVACEGPRTRAEVVPSATVSSLSSAVAAPPEAAPKVVVSATPMDAGAPDVGPAGYVFDFTDADLPELVRAVSVITGRRIILTGQLPKVKATVHSPDRVTAEEAYQAFLTVLDDNGLTVVRQGAFENVVTKASLLGR